MMDNLNDIQIRQRLDQIDAMNVDRLPALWCGLYRGLVEGGLREDQALELLKTYIVATQRQ